MTKRIAFAVSTLILASLLIPPGTASALAVPAAAYGIPVRLRGKEGKPPGRLLREKTRAAMRREAHRFVKPLARGAAWKTYVNERYGIAIGYPANWSAADAYMDTVVSFLSPRTGTEDALTENVNILVDEGRGKALILAAATEQALEELRGLENFSLLESAPAVYGNREARAVVYTSGSDPALKFKQAWLIHRGDLLILTFAAGTRTFPEYVRHFDRMLQTLELK